MSLASGPARAALRNQSDTANARDVATPRRADGSQSRRRQRAIESIERGRVRVRVVVVVVLVVGDYWNRGSRVRVRKVRQCVVSKDDLVKARWPWAPDCGRGETNGRQRIVARRPWPPRSLVDFIFDNPAGIRRSRPHALTSRGGAGGAGLGHGRSRGEQTRQEFSSVALLHMPVMITVLSPQQQL